MTEEKAKRKLVAVVHADVKGYSRMMGEDDEYTVRTLASNREEMYRLVGLHGGQVRDTAGDGFLVEFPSVVDAVKFSVEFQREMKQRNVDLPEDRKMEFRIGVNIGDVIHDGSTIHGDGVNIAARLEGLADPGGICISGAAYEQVKKKLDVDFEYVGKKSVKNIAEPVPTFKVLIEPGETLQGRTKPSRIGRAPWQRTYFVAAGVIVALIASAAIWYAHFHSAPPPENAASGTVPELTLPHKPSVAVLPFENLSGDPNQEYFSDGITEEIIAGLSKVPKLFVIALHSSFAFKDKLITVGEVGRKLGVRYVLEGSVRRQGDRVRITAQLIDANTGGHIWSERYDRHLKDIFALQDEITRKIMLAMQVKLTEGEQERLKNERDKTDSLEAYERYLRGAEYLRKSNRDANAMAYQMFEEAIALDPNYARPYAALGVNRLFAIWWGWTDTPVEDMRKAYMLTKKALSLNDSVDFAHYAMGFVYLMARKHDKAIEEGKRAVALSPNGADALMFLGFFYNAAGKPEEAIPLLRRGIRLNPSPPAVYYHVLGVAYRMTKQYQKAIAAFRKGLSIRPDNAGCLLALTATYSVAGRDREARETARRLLAVDPGFSVKEFAATVPFKNPADTKRFVDALRKAGLN